MKSAAISPKPKLRKCKACKAPFEKRSMAHIACSPACAIELGKQAKAKRERAEYKAKKESIKDRGEWLEDAQKACNAFIRFRDRNQPCICCGKPFEEQKFGGSMDAGHYLSRGSAPHLRFDERNIHGQRKNCNRPGGTTREAFRAGMIARIGLEAVEALEADQTPRKWSSDELRAIKAHYKAKLKELKAREGA